MIFSTLKKFLTYPLQIRCATTGAKQYSEIIAECFGEPEQQLNLKDYVDFLFVILQG